MAAEGNGDPPVPDLRTMEELCQPSLNGRGDDVNKHLDKFLHVTQSIKVNGVTDDAFRLYLFPHSLKHHATAWFDRLPRNYINTFEQMTTMFLGKYFPPYMVTKLRNEITNFHQSLKAEMAEIKKNLMRVLQVNKQVKAVTPSCETCGGPHSYNDCPAIVGQTEQLPEPKQESRIPFPQGNNQGRNQFFQGASHGQNPPPAYQAPGYQAQANDAILKNTQTNMTSLTNSNLELKNMFGQFMKMNTASSSSSGTLPGNTITNTKEDLKGITTRSGSAYQGPIIHTTSSSLPKVVERETDVTKDTVPPINNGSTKDVQPSVIQAETPKPNFEPVVAPVGASKPNQKPSIPYPSRLSDKKFRDKANDQKEKFFKIFQDLNFNISFADALILMPKFGPTIKTLLTNKDKLFELTRTPLNEHCSTVLLKKFLEKLGDPGKFLILCDFLGMDECLALVDIDASINLMPLSVWNKLSLPKLSSTYMTLKLADRSISSNYNDMMENRIGIIDMAYEEYSHEFLGFFDVIASSNPTPYYDPIVSTTSLTLTLFGDSDFLLEEVDAFLGLEDDPTLPKVDQSYFDTEGDILLLEVFLNDDPSLPPPNQGIICLKFERNLKFMKLKLINHQLMSLPRFSDEEKTALITVLKSHKRAIAWKLSDIKGINLEYCTHKIRMEEDFKPAVQHQRRVNPNIHDVIKKAVEKLLDAGSIYPISDSPWVFLCFFA
nr:reverse transcriptase domain-containing protein [Tanacetum cinerariifolium]